jgi:uncharacterized protein (TIGR02594 family)
MSYLHNQPERSMVVITPSAYLVAINELGVHEVAGKPATARVSEYLSTCKDLSKADRLLDETPWCSAFRNWCEIQGGGKGTDSAAAKSWAAWGLAVPSMDAARTGDTLVFRRDSGHHVAFFTGVIDAKANRVRVLGGNQTAAGNGGEVTIGSCALADLLAIRRAW